MTTSLMHPHRVNELFNTLQKKVEQVPSDVQIDNAIQSSVEAIASEWGHPIISSADHMSERVWEHVEIRAVEFLGFDFDEIWEVGQ